MELDVHNPIPLHVQLKEILKNEILQGSFTERIPSERELMDTYSVSRTTVREAISALVREGVLEKIHGKGTFVCFRPVEEWLGQLSSYTETIESMGMKPGIKLLSHGASYSPKNMSLKLGVENFYVIERLRFANDIPVAIERHYYPLEIGLKLVEYDLNTAILYDVLELSMGVTLWEAEQFITSGPPAKEDARHLEIPQTSCVLLTERLTKDPDGNAIECLRGVFRSDMYAFRIKTARKRG